MTRFQPVSAPWPCAPIPPAPFAAKPPQLRQFDPRGPSHRKRVLTLPLRTGHLPLCKRANARAGEEKKIRHGFPRSGVLCSPVERTFAVSAPRRGHAPEARQFATGRCKVRLDRQRLNRFIKQDGFVNQNVTHKENPSSSAGKSPTIKASADCCCACHLTSSHNSNLLP